MTDRRKFDRKLDQDLRSTDARVDVVGAREIFRGIATTPVADDEDAWRTLIAPQASPELIEDLRDLRERVLGSIPDDGLSHTRTDPKRIAALRKELKRRDLDGFIVPKADEHQGEFVARRSERLQWATGFSGSAGSAIIMQNKNAAIFIDGRYTLQVKKQVDGKLFEYVHTADRSQIDWLRDNLGSGMRLGYDPWLHTEAMRRRIKDACMAADAALVAVADNPVDAVWKTQPVAPISPMVPHPQKYAGENAAKKRAKIAKILKDKNLDAAVLSAPDAIAWLLNIRGRDVPCTPLPLSFAIIHQSGGVELFTDPSKLAPDTEAHLGAEVIVLEWEALAAELGHLGTRGCRVGVDLNMAPAKIATTLKDAGADVVSLPDPTASPKAEKNTAEQKGTRNAHLRDGIAMVKFLCWLDKEAGKGRYTEWDVGLKVDDLRAELDLHRGPSFSTIAGFGANGAVVHYRADKKKSATVKKGSLLLVDSGGQYLDGTTDVTRTVAIGKPTNEMRDRYTRVLMGHIDLARAIFPEGTSGSQLDALARKPLWDLGLDYEHGTGHGVGSYLGVHEGPQRISKFPSSVALQPGMIVSNEPGYYKARAFGIRIENLVMVKTVKLGKGAERRLLGFENLTCAPYDSRLIDPKLLTKTQITWLNDYHAWVKKSLSGNLDAATKRWLAAATKPIKG